MSSRRGSVRSRSGLITAWAALVCAAAVGAQLGGGSRGGGAPVEAGGLAPVHRAMVESIERGEAMVGNVAACFAPGTDEAVIDAFLSAMDRVAPDRFQQTGRWSGTVAMGSAGTENQPITLTYSFAPDGTFIPTGMGEPQGVSNLFAFMNGIYGSEAVWQGLFHQVFDRWEYLTGINYVYEPNDDGSSFFGNPGQVSVRGDIRIAAKPIDGNGNTLGYNFFPAGGGDMVLDSSDSYFTNTSSNSRRLRNVAAHENGHGTGQLHVCPVLGEKIMEPVISTGYDGPLHDDIRNAHDHYGDAYEPNQLPIQAVDLGTVAAGTTAEPGKITNPTLVDSSRLSLNELDTSPFTNDEDWFKFSIDGEGVLNIRVTPLGKEYEDNPQSCPGQMADCCSGTLVDSQRLADVNVQLLDSTGSSVLATADSAGIGDFEEIAGWPVGGGETFMLRIYTPTNSFFQPQMYALTIQQVPPPGPEPFVLVSPVNGATGVELGPVLDWETSNNADTYLVEVDTDLFFGSPDVSQVVFAPMTQLDLADGTLLGSQQYYWRVTAGNDVGTIISQPQISGFTTRSPPPACDGDLDGDGDTDVFDFALFANNFGQSVTPGTGGDLDNDGDVDVFDFSLFASDFGCVP